MQRRDVRRLRARVIIAAVILCALALAFLRLAFGEQTFRAWTYGQAAVVCLLLALVLVKLYEVWRA